MKYEVLSIKFEGLEEWRERGNEENEGNEGNEEYEGNEGNMKSMKRMKGMKAIWMQWREWRLPAGDKGVSRRFVCKVPPPNSQIWQTS